MISRLVLVTGAGASRNLGGNGKTLPLMNEWSDALYDALWNKSADLVDLLGIRRGQSGPVFEKAIGDFLAWQRVLPKAARFLPFGLTQPDQRVTDNWESIAARRAEQVIEALNETLYRQFGEGQIWYRDAASAYAALLSAVDFPRDGSLCVATTNYDPAAELALAELEMRPDAGDVAGRDQYRWLDPARLLDRCHANHGVPVIHLHGRVGWYTQPDGRVRVEEKSVAFNPSAGDPTVLMPDPDKDPLTQPAIRELWGQFDQALRDASHVLVLGHSLNDPVLMDHIRANTTQASLAVSMLPQDALRQDSLDHVQRTLPTAHVVPMVFGPEPTIETFDKWLVER